MRSAPSTAGSSAARFTVLVVRFALAFRWFGANLKIDLAVDRGGR